MMQANDSYFTMSAIFHTVSAIFHTVPIAYMPGRTICHYIYSVEKSPGDLMQHYVRKLDTYKPSNSTFSKSII